MENIRERILACRSFAYAWKEHYPDANDVIIGTEEIRDGGDVWLVSAESEINPPASVSEIKAIEKLYKASLAAEHREFLMQTNGAKLFIIPRTIGQGVVSRCAILSTRELLTLHGKLMEVIHNMHNLVPEQLHYIPVADVTNNSYVAVSTNPDSLGEVFSLAYWGFYHPYTPKGRELYYPKVFASSFPSWLDRVLETYGAFGIDK